MQSNDKDYRQAVRLARFILASHTSGDRYESDAMLTIAKALIATAEHSSTVAPKPIAWRYKLRYSGMEWKLVDTEDECNSLAVYEREPLYAAPSARGAPYKCFVEGCNEPALDQKPYDQPSCCAKHDPGR